MEENVALDTTKQKKFVKSIKGIKKLIKKNETDKSEEATISKPKKEKAKRKRPERGLVYLAHIPHGFYEHEMTQYFKQFGVVTNARVIRSKRTGNSKGYAFVEFKEPSVAEIVAETMNNYLMGKRLIKAAYIPPEKQRPKAMRKHWSRLNNPGRDKKLKMKKAYNENKDEKGELKRARKLLSNINKTKKKLSELGISYDFFTPVDVPDVLKEELLNKESNENNIKESIIKVEKKSKENKKAKSQKVESKEDTESLVKDKIVKDKRQVKNEKNKKIEEKKGATLKVEDTKSQTSREKKSKSKVPEPVVNKKEQKQKQQKLKEAGVNLPEKFIKVQEDSEDSDSSLEFDSDEYENMLADDSGEDSDIDDDNEFSDDGESEDSDDEEDTIPAAKKSKGKPTPQLTMPQKKEKKSKAPMPEPAKRKVPQKPPIAAKKPKFEKQTQQLMKKQFKKKK